MLDKILRYDLYYFLTLFVYAMRIGLNLWLNPKNNKMNIEYLIQSYITFIGEK